MAERREISDVEELRAIFSAVKDFLGELGPMIKSLLSIVLEEISGEKIGKDVAAFYKFLSESGISQDQVMELTRKYYEDRMSVIKVVKDIPEFFRKWSEIRRKVVE